MQAKNNMGPNKSVKTNQNIMVSTVSGSIGTHG